MKLVTKERILLHLFAYARYEKDFEVPNALSQEGIAQAIFAPRAYVSAVLKEMAEEGVVYERLAHVDKGFRRKNVYFLTESGKERAKSLFEKIKAEMPEAFEDFESFMLRAAGKKVEGLEKEIVLFGRDSEIARLKEFVNSKQRIFMVYGLPGIGKTALLQYFAKSNGFPYLELSVPLTSVEEFYIWLAEALARKGRYRLKRYLERNGYCGEARVLALDEVRNWVLCIDALENAENCLSEIRYLSSSAKIVASARERIPCYGEQDLLSGEVREIWLEPLSRESAMLMLASEGVKERESQEQIFEKALGHPLMMLLLAHGGSVANWKYLFEEIFSKLSEGEKEVLKILALLKENDSIWQTLGIDEILSLERKGLIYFSDGWRVHKILQNFVLEAMSPEEKVQLSEKIWRIAFKARALKPGMRVLVECENYDFAFAKLVENYAEFLRNTDLSFLEWVVERLKPLERGEIGCIGAELALRRGDWKKALELLNGICERLTSYWEMEKTYILGRAYNLATDYARAVEIAKNGYERFGNPNFLILLGRAYAGMQEGEKALEVFLDALAKGAEQGVALAEIANLLLEKERFEEAVSYFERAIQLTGDGSIKNKMKINLAIALAGMGEGAKARELLFEVLKNAEEAGELINSGFACVNLSHLLLENEPKKAESYARKALEIGERFCLELLIAPALINLGKAEIALGRVEEGKRKVEQGKERYEKIGMKVLV